jgi:hypothetical protein
MPDLISILPFDIVLQDTQLSVGRVARLARFARLFRLLRAGVVLYRVAAHDRGVVRTNGLGYLLMLVAAVLVGGGYAIFVA